MKELSSRSKKKGGKVFPALCNILGTLILLTVIVSCLPVTVPRLLGYEIYNVVSGSMAPEIPVGSIVYVETYSPAEIQEGEIIAFQSGDGVITHRVVKNNVVEGEFTTKGDANAAEDMNTVDYRDLIGRVVRHYPYLGALMVVYTSGIGKIYVICFAACGAMLNLLAMFIRNRREEEAEEE